jgi:peptidoglycan/LPS O-acetylase OafA/YrhL
MRKSSPATLPLAEVPLAGQTISHELPFIDFVRGFSSLLVVIAHCGSFIWGQRPQLAYAIGALGVDFFIIVSGFLMTYTLVRSGKGELPPLSRRSLGLFYIRRYFRIAPLFYVIYLFSFLVAPVGLWDALFHFSFLNGLVPKYAGSVIPNSWSITLEMQFYLVVPFLLAAARRLSVRFVLIGCAALNLLASSLFDVYLPGGRWAFFAQPSLLPLCLGLFGIGIVLCLRQIRSPYAPSLRWSILLIALEPLLHPPYLHRFAAAGLALAVLGLQELARGPRSRAGRALDTGRKRFLAALHGNPWVKRAADYSYGLYLIHGFAIDFLAARMMRQECFRTMPAPLAFGFVLVVVLAVSYTAAFVTFNLIERPGVTLGRWVQDKVFPSRARH